VFFCLVRGWGWLLVLCGWGLKGGDWEERAGGVRSELVEAGVWRRWKGEEKQSERAAAPLRPPPPPLASHRAPSLRKRGSRQLTDRQQLAELLRGLEDLLRVVAVDAADHVRELVELWGVWRGGGGIVNCGGGEKR
jgi:hypothetical protein